MQQPLSSSMEGTGFYLESHAKKSGLAKCFQCVPFARKAKAIQTMIDHNLGRLELVCAKAGQVIRQVPLADPATPLAFQEGGGLKKRKGSLVHARHVSIDLDGDVLLLAHKDNDVTRMFYETLEGVKAVAATPSTVALSSPATSTRTSRSSTLTLSLSSSSLSSSSSWGLRRFSFSAPEPMVVDASSAAAAAAEAEAVEEGSTTTTMEQTPIALALPKSFVATGDVHTVSRENGPLSMWGIGIVAVMLSIIATLVYLPCLFASWGTAKAAHVAGWLVELAINTTVMAVPRVDGPALALGARVGLGVVASHTLTYGLHTLAAAGSLPCSGAITWTQLLLSVLAFLTGCRQLMAAGDCTAGIKSLLLPGLIVGFLKQTSFAAVSGVYRVHLAAGDLATYLERAATEHPTLHLGPITASSYAYFLAAPTLIYQTSYPRASRISWARVAGLALHLAAIGALCGVMALGWIYPLLAASHGHLGPLNDPVATLLLLLRIAVPSTMTWLLGVAYGVFHVGLNLVAELTRFGDRRFYGEWWNVANLRDFWCLWNLPVHNFLKRHVLYTLKDMRVHVYVSFLTVFFFSAILHEVAILVPYGTTSLYAGFGLLGPSFQGMMSQAIGAPLTHALFGKHRRIMGNMAFWMMFCVIGQPIAVLWYYRDLVVNAGASA